MARPKKAVAVKAPRKPRSDKGVKRKNQGEIHQQVVDPGGYAASTRIIAEKMAAEAEQNEAMVGRTVDVPLEEQVVNLRRERNRYCNRASYAEGALRRELNYHQLRVEEIDVLLEQLHDLRYA